ncbi:hypothetical protein BJV82DRAFT_714885 [Fennellomyces sp. T-0311]|nr:hypothetical protein BJV82DRAFT_714885 [Fennellomyces sp. T-0311]
MEDDYDDNWITDDVLDVIDQLETQYVGSQQVPLSTTVSNYNHLALPSTAPGLVVDQPTADIPNRHHQYNQQTEHTIDELRFNEDRLKLRLAQEETARESMQRDLEQIRSELRFKDHELEGLKFELRFLKAKAKSTDAGTPATPSTASTATTARRSVFPDGAGFSDPLYNKRNAHVRSRSTTPSPGPSIQQRVERKRNVEAMAMDSTPKKLVKPEVPDTNKTRHAQFLRRLLGSEYRQLQIEKQDDINENPKTWPSPLITKLSEQFSRRLVPSQKNKRLAILGADFADCIIRSNPPNLNITIQQLMNLLGHLLTISIKDKLFEVVSKAIETINMLSSSYDEARRYLWHEFQRVEEDSMLYKMVACLELFDILPAENEPHLHHIPYVPGMTIRELTTFCRLYKLTPTELDILIKREASDKFSHTCILHILNTYIHLIEIDVSMQHSLHFLLKKGSFLKLLSTNAPIPIVINAIDLLSKLVCDDRIAFLSKVAVDRTSIISPVSMLTSLLHMRQPSEAPNDIENWFIMRIKAVETLISIIDDPATSNTMIQQACAKLSTPLQQMCYDECVRLEHINHPPYTPIRFDRSEQLINISLDLIYSVLQCCGMSHLVEQEMFTTSMKRMEHMQMVIREIWGHDHAAGEKIRDIEKLLKTLYQGTMQSDSDFNTMGTK